ncbi:hypothetical protein KL935_002360 [Ogataea polymorpha]|nr:hypothetical protein KL937_001780 [Ogataea polymorpha]KAG7893671.1 hypothetical protein KL908_002725 [Ogataea polymorpha]KAG7901294.1 hypothetical protein KL935_002360 [Ogataea polymorpha]KAG7905647.1 hypothetical protein KL907_002794 [Ogataea polymorpha]KAG7909548.1 hypothetical protein KL906_002304 [Ogataea polymorpha]
MGDCGCELTFRKTGSALVKSMEVKVKIRKCDEKLGCAGCPGDTRGLGVGVASNLTTTATFLLSLLT